MTKSVWLCLGLLLVLANKCEDDLGIKKYEECWNSLDEVGKLLCTDLRLPKEERVYTRHLGQDRLGNRIEDITTNSTDFKALKDDYIDTKKKYLVCKKHPKKCV